MKNTCRFCHKAQVALLFAATENPTHKESYEFACTNSGFGVHGPIVECPQCKMIYVDEKITQQKISAYYEVAEDPVYFAEQKARRATFKYYLGKLEKVTPGKGKLLDVGTFTGLFVKVALEAGWKAVGIEPNKWGVEFARKNYQINIINKPFEKGVFAKDSFDVITMWDVIEHFTDPVKEMEKVFWHLRPGGIFAFSTVDPKSPLAVAMGTRWSWYMEMHRVLISREAARYYLAQAGFKNIVFRPHWRFLSAGYLASRLKAVHPALAKLAGATLNLIGASKVIVPYYANDLYDCYAQKP